MEITNFTVLGMTCSHCVASVTEEVNEIPGVSRAEVDLASGRLSVASTKPVDGGLVRAAVVEAGYEVAPGDAT